MSVNDKLRKFAVVAAGKKQQPVAPAKQISVGKLPNLPAYDRNDSYGTYAKKINAVLPKGAVAKIQNLLASHAAGMSVVGKLYSSNLFAAILVGVQQGGIKRSAKAVAESVLKSVVFNIANMGPPKKPAEKSKPAAPKAAPKKLATKPKAAPAKKRPSKTIFPFGGTLEHLKSMPTKQLQALVKHAQTELKKRG